MKQILLITALLIVWPGFTARAVPADPASNVTLTVSPATISFATHSTARVVVTARLANRTVQSLVLSYFTDDPLRAAIEKPTRSVVPSMGDVAWDVRIKPLATAISSGRIHFRANYKMVVAGQVVPGVVISTVDIQDRVTDPIEKVISLELLSAIDTLQDDQSRDMYLVVKNIGPVPVMAHVTVSPFASVSSSGPNLGKELRLKPQEAYPVLINLKAKPTVEPGKSLVVVKVDAEWDMDGRRRTGSVVTSKEIKLGVFGESAILEATTIPSVLLLPGFLFVITLVLLTQWTWHKQILELEFKKPTFWFISITLSLVAVLTYKEVTGPVLSWLHQQPMSSGDFLHGYGFKDIIRLWLGSVTLGIMVWGVGSSALAVRNWYQEKKVIPSTEDSALEILEKLVRNRKGFDLVNVQLKGSGRQKLFAFPVPFTPGKVWVIPRILYAWMKKDDSVKGEFDQLTLSEEDTKTLVERLKCWHHQVIDLEWQWGPDAKGPKELNEDEIEEIGSSNSIFKEKK